jgi:hypothetical protein
VARSLAPQQPYTRQQPRKISRPEVQSNWPTEVFGLISVLFVKMIPVKITEKDGAATVGPMVKGMLRPVGGLENDPQPRLEPEALVHLGSGSCVYEAGLRLVEATAAPYPGGPAASSQVGCRRQKDGLPEQRSSPSTSSPSLLSQSSSSHWTLVGSRKIKALNAREGRSLLVWGVPRDIDASKVRNELLPKEIHVDSCVWRGRGNDRHVYLTLTAGYQRDAWHQRAVRAGKGYHWRIAKGRTWANRAEHRAASSTKKVSIAVDQIDLTHNIFDILSDSSPPLFTTTQHNTSLLATTQHNTPSHDATTQTTTCVCW